MVRVIGGIYKGRKLKSSEGLKTRPTPSIVREALFDILGERVKGSYFLDLYAGFGCVGIEALSRGAAFSMFVEENFKTSSIIKENLKLLGINSGYQILAVSALKSIKKIYLYNLKFDFIFLDPPYSESPFMKFFELLCENNILSKGGEIIIQHSKKSSPEIPEGYLLKKEYNYGDTSLLFALKKED
ncbi:MAG: 16S rRNA (guanine(966)-N(2))-methyltransferase RsmD [Acidobacteriota bacterium]